MTKKVGRGFKNTQSPIHVIYGYGPYFHVGYINKINSVTFFWWHNPSENRVHSVSENMKPYQHDSNKLKIVSIAHKMPRKTQTARPTSTPNLPKREVMPIFKTAPLTVLSRGICHQN